MSNNEKVYYELTHPQKRIWCIDKINTNSPLHNIGGCLKINETIDVDVMNQTINFLIKKNDALRLRILGKDQEPIQYIKDFQKEDIDFWDFSNYKNPQNEYNTWSNEIFKKFFNLEDNKLYYFAIYKISEREYGILLNIHHIISDGWSITLIQKQICEIYSKLINKEETKINECYSYLDFIKDEEEYLNTERFLKNKDFWKSKFLDVPEDFLYKTTNSLEGKRKCFSLDSEMSNTIKKFVGEKKCSLNTFFIVILLIYINKTTYKKDLVIGTPVFNRISKEHKGMIGMFTSTVPFRFKLDTKLKLEDLIKLVNRELKLCFINQKYPYDFLIKDLELGKAGYDSLFKMCVNYYNSKYVDDMNGADIEVKEYYCGNQSYSMQLIVKEWEEGKIELYFDYKTLEYSDKQIQKMYEVFMNIINQVVNDGKLQVSDIKLVNNKENNYKLYELNSTSSHYPKKTIFHLFEEQADRTPNRDAVEFKGETLTYKELNEKSNQLANYLKQKGIDNNSIIAIMETHSIELIVSILGVLKSGAAYLPIDHNYPVGRINYMLEDSKCDILLSNLKMKDEIKFQGSMINIKDLNFEGYNNINLTQTCDLNDLVYIIYTSGSTGRPKGVMIEHKGLTNYIWWANKMYLKDKDEVMALYSSISFDLTVTSIFTPLVSGNKIIIYDNDEIEYVLNKVLRENKVTVLKLTPSHLSLLKDMDNSKSNIKMFIVGGEDLKVNLAKAVYNSFGKNIEIFNEYGPTETVVGCMTYKYDEGRDNDISVPIGYPADNVQIYILDNELNTIPTGFEGEIYISGDGVARGYLNRDDLTMDRFIKNPFIEGKMMYRTGDTARYLETGAIEYVGRIDKQVKIRGHRVEISEIERYLLENEFVKDAVVVYKENSVGNKLLTAYIVAKKEIIDSGLKQQLLKFLPEYMIPNNFIFMDKLPLTINGKVFYDLLPEPTAPKTEFVKYATSTEKELVKIMEDILGIENISMTDNYYNLGGDSIKAIQISSKLKNIGLGVKVKDILALNSIEEIADKIKESDMGKFISQEQSFGNIEEIPIVEWFFSQNFKNLNFYNQYVLLEYNGVLDINQVTTIVNKLVEHHDGLRINYNRKDNKLFYNNKYLNTGVLVDLFDLTKYPQEEQCKNIEDIIENINSSFNIENSLLFNATIFQLRNGKQTILFTAHHLLVDGVSWRIILDDFFTILKQLENNETIKLPMKTNSLKEWSETLQEYKTNNFHDEKHYWESVLDKDNLCLKDLNKNGDTGETSKILISELDESTLSGLIKNANEIYNMELNEALIIGLVLALNKLTDNDEVVIELEKHGRESINDQINVSRTVGWFTSIYPAYFKIEHESIEDNLKSLKEQLRNIPNKGFNYSIFKFLKKEFREQKNNFIRLNYLGNFDNVIDKGKLNLSNIEFGLSSDKNNSLTALMDIEIMIINKKLKIKITYSSNRFEHETVEKLIKSYICTLKLILFECSNKKCKEFTPSDFDAVEISQEDLDALFD